MSALGEPIRYPEKMLRLLFIILLLVLLLALVRRFLPGKPDTPDEPDEPRIAKMVRCDYCRIYIPQTSAIKHAERYYCCDEHKSMGSE